ncbi:MAG TPA: aminopeptidase, partial [Candidatus Krumholzibacteriaceae bacterium]
MDKLLSAAKRAIVQSLKVKRGEKLLLVTDRQKMRIAEALAYWAKKSNAEVTTYLMTETLRPIDAPTAIFKEMMAMADLTMYLLDARVAEKPFRGYMVANGAKKGRICMMPGITVDMMERLVNIDFAVMDRLTKKVIRTLEASPNVRVTNNLGTDITFSVKGRRWDNDNGDISKRGKHGNLPAGECYTCPVEGTFTGRIVFSLIDDKVGRGEMIFKKGKLVSFKGAGIAEIMKGIGSDPTGRMIGEFGIGTNRGA